MKMIDVDVHVTPTATDLASVCSEKEEEEDFNNAPIRAPFWALPCLVFSQFCGTSLWFAPNAVLTQIETFHLKDISTLTSMAQVGFILGTFTFSYFAIPDRFNAPVLFCCMAMLGAVFNILCALTDLLSAWIFLRILVGFCLAGVYPVGMKIAAKIYPEGLGARMGVLLGALTLGTAFPWLIRGLDETGLPPKLTLGIVSLLAAFGGVVMVVVLGERGEKLADIVDLLRLRAKKQTKHLDLGFAAMKRIWSEKGLRTAAIGYFGHSWELYGFWVNVPFLIQANADVNNGESILNLAFTTFLVIGIGFVSSTLAGLCSLRLGSGKVAMIALATSGLCCFLAPTYRFMSPGVFLAYVIIWGGAVVADSGQFSSLCAKNAPPDLVGSALTLTVCVGFVITVTSIEIVGAALKAGLDPGYAMMILSPGPVIGVAVGYKRYVARNSS